MDDFMKHPPPCEGCFKAAKKNHKHTRKTPAQRNATRPEQPGAVIHGDLFDLPKECEGATKGALFVDSGTSNSWLYFINGKTEQHLAPVIKHLLSTVVSDGYTPRQIWYDGE